LDADGALFEPRRLGPAQPTGVRHDLAAAPWPALSVAILVRAWRATRARAAPQ
jgi:hypothetical protein